MPTSPTSPVSETDTIVAIATPPGRGGLGIVRLSGPHAWHIATQLVRLDTPLQAGRARVAGVRDPADPARTPIDQAVVTAFQAPHSYTGENIVEIAAHGSPIVLEALLQGALSSGARLAEPGEFTQRAFLNHRIDLTQAEAIHDLIAAQTLEQARMAAQQLGGALSRRVAPIKERLLHLIALLEAGMDFASGELDDVDVVPPQQIAATVAEVVIPLQQLAASYTAGHRLREGATLALVGRPNVGKSSLFNRLLERDRAIVTPQPGTTRDTVEEVLAIGGIPVRLIDTAGLRLAGETPADQAEEMGILRSQEALADADLVLLVLDATAPIAAEERTLLHSFRGRPHLLVHNKIDLLSGNPERHPHPAPSVAASSQQEPDALLTSAHTGEGIGPLRDAILRILQGSGSPVAEGMLNNLRQRHAVEESIAALQAASQANANRLPHELLLIDLHRALHALDLLTGATTTDDILNRIFSTFCIGK
ncbi:MAG TPA: tRNA uridine-5-carboxymethylaminomethyl(34) synthesis GTPase MnmE [Acidobacteriaceae bacterium]|jgi:tRNA modification GTPase|nr:tRNA uridine-5-carboxymethylaminomethyl(34) synthesis GTPase MnmE [Acidobacteriaceae bacterium]